MQIRTPDVPAASALPRNVAAAQTVPSPDSNPISAPTPVVDVHAAVHSANKTLKTLSSSVEFIVDMESRRTIVRVMDTDTGQLIRQFPSEEMLAISDALDRLRGLLITDQA